MKRIKNFDTIRGCAIFLMVLGHFLDWWLTEEDYWLYLMLEGIFSFVAVAFLFISGAATMLAYKSRQLKLGNEKHERNFFRNEFILRGLILLFISFIYNFISIFAVNLDFAHIWSWNVLQAIAISLLLSYPLLKLSKLIRILIAIIILILNYYILSLLYPFHGQDNLNGVIFFLLFNPTDQYIFLAYFFIFIIGTVIGEIIFNIFNINNAEELKNTLKVKFNYPLVIYGIILLIFGITNLFFDYTSFFFKTIILRVASLSMILYSLGLMFILISLMTYIEVFKPIKTKKSYRFFYFYSFYSFTIYIGQDILYLFFPHQLTVVTVWIPAIIGLILTSLIIRYLYKKLGYKVSLKAQISISATYLARKIQKKTNNE